MNNKLHSNFIYTLPFHNSEQNYSQTNYIGIHAPCPCFLALLA